jgi:predicted nucleotidyltransferase
MPTVAVLAIPNLPDHVGRAISEFVEAAQKSLGPDLRAAVLYGSAAEGRLRPTSDVNLMLLLSNFDREKVDELREPMRVARAAIQLRVMFLLESEVPAAVRLFAQKFADISRRRRVLFGEDPFASVTISGQDELQQLRRELLNLVLRMRAAYVLVSLRPEQLAGTVADMAGPLRSCASTLLALEGQPVLSPKEALRSVAASVEQPDAEAILSHLSDARENRALPAQVADATLLGLIELARRMQARAEALA